jgi:hypothetical protein
MITPIGSARVYKKNIMHTMAISKISQNINAINKYSGAA